MAEKARGERHGQSRLLSPYYHPGFRTDLQSVLALKEAQRPESLKELVRHQTEESYDVFSLVQLTHAGFDLALQKQHRNEGEAILQGVEAYLLKERMLCKYLFPLREESPTADDIADILRYDVYDQMKKMVMEIGQYARRYEAQLGRKEASFVPRGSEIQSVIEAVPLNLPDLQKKETATIPLMRISSRHERDATMRLSMISTHGDLFPAKPGEREALGKGKSERDESYQRRQQLLSRNLERVIREENPIQTPEELLDVLYAARGRLGAHDIVSEQHGNTSLEEILATGDRRERMFKTMRYVADLPRGDAFWRQITRRVLFMPQVAIRNAQFKHPEWTERLYETQLDISAAFLGPAITRDAPDMEVWDAMGDMLRKTDPGTAAAIGVSLLQAAKFAPFAHVLLHPDSSVNAFVESNSFYQSVLRAYYSRLDRSNPNVPEIVLLDEMIHWAYVTGREAIREGWQQLTADPRKLTGIDPYLNEEASQTYTEAQTDIVMDILSRRLGESFWERMNGLAIAELEDVQTSMMKSFTDRKMMGYWPTGGDLHNVVFNGNKLPSMLGFESISFLTPKVDESYGSEIRFVMQLADPKIAIRGELPVDFLSGSGSMKLSIDLSAYPGLQSIMRSVVIATFHDLVLRNRLLRMKTAGKPDSETKSSRPGRHRTGAVEKKGEHRQELPRSGHSVLDEPYIESEELRTQIDRAISSRDTSYTPQKIDPHAMALPGASRYQHAVRQYLERLAIPDEQNATRAAELAELATAVVQARKEMYNISEEKRNMLDSLPPSFRGEIRFIADPLSEAHEPVYLTTWVSDYTKPKPTDEELRSPKKMHERFYRTGPQTRFLDVFMMWLWGNV